MKGVKYRPMSSGRMLARNMMIYGLGGVIAPFVRHQAHRYAHRIRCWRFGLASKEEYDYERE